MGQPIADDAGGPGAAARVEDLVARFEAAWREGRRPALADFVPADDSLRLAALAELIPVDLDYRLRAGEEVRLESYLEQYPELARTPSVVPALAFAEFRLRRRSQPDLALDEVVERFPEHGPQLADALRTLSVATAPFHDDTEPQKADAPPGPLPPPIVNWDPTQDWPKIPDYRVVGELGRGAMGVVYRAVQESLDRPVAIKVISAGEHATPEQRRRFRTEALAIARLQHPNIIQVYAVGDTDGRPYIVMEMVDGSSLTNQLGGKPRPFREAAATIETLARAVEHAHRRGVIHRDLKPANVLLTADGTPKIADFGLAKRLDSSAVQTASGSVLGTPAYMAPEQVGLPGVHVGPATDVYALGAILYEALTGRPPFRGETAIETIYKSMNEEPDPPSKHRPDCPPELEAVCLRCLRKKPEERYASAAALAEEMRRFLASPATSPREEVPPVSRGPGRWLGVGLAAAAALVLLILGVFAGKYFLAPPATTELARVSRAPTEKVEPTRKEVPAPTRPAPRETKPAPRETGPARASNPNEKPKPVVHPVVEPPKQHPAAPPPPPPVVVPAAPPKPDPRSVHITLVVEHAPSMNRQNRLSDVKEVLAKALGQLPPGPQVSLWAFGDDNAPDVSEQLAKPEPWKPDQANGLVNRIGDASGEEDRLFIGHTMMKARKDLDDKGGPRLLLVIADGADHCYKADMEFNREGLDLEKVLPKQFDGSGIRIVFIGFKVTAGDREDVQKQFAFVRNLKPQPGRFVLASNRDELTEAVQKALQEAVQGAGTPAK
jgi:predicted Ser/Thr protein kinase